MRLSDAQTRGPGRKKWRQYMKALKIIDILEEAAEDCTLEEQYKFFEATVLAKTEASKILAEVSRALTVGAESQKDEDPDVPLHELLPGDLGQPRQLLELLPKEGHQISEVQLFRQLFLRPESGVGDSEKLGEPPPSQTEEESQPPTSESEGKPE